MVRHQPGIWIARALSILAFAIVVWNANSFAQPVNNQMPVGETRARTDLPSAPPHSITGTLTLPSGWITTNPITVSFQVTTASTKFETGSLSNDGVNWGALIPATNDQRIATVWNVGNDSVDKKIYLRLDSAQGRTPTIINQTINVDTQPPVSRMTLLPPFSSRTFSMFWSATDETSGVASYDVQMRVGETGTWVALLSRSTLTKTIIEGAPGDVYYFRVRAIDNAGNAESWRVYDTLTSIPQTD